MSFKLDTNNVRQVRHKNKWHPLCFFQGNSYTSRSTSSRIPSPSFALIKHYSPMRRCEIHLIWVSHVFQVEPPVTPHLVKKVMVIFGSWPKKACSLDCCYGNNIVGIILYLTWCTLLVPSMNDITNNLLPWDILEFVIYNLKPKFDVTNFKAKSWISQEIMKKDLSKKKMPFLLTFSGCSNMHLHNFLLRVHFKIVCLLWWLIRV